MKDHNEIYSFACRALNIDKNDNAAMDALSARGSDRTFYRLVWNETSAIVIDYDPVRCENNYYADIARFLKGMYVPVPEVLAHDPEKKLMILEDLGDRDLDSFRNHEWPSRRALYHKTLGAVKRLHRISAQNLPHNVRLMEDFSPALYLDEQNYFIDFFVKGYCDISPESPFEVRLRSELAGLSDRLEKAERCLIHRDLQSQNVMIRNDDPYFIDFQGMRIGNPFYDLGSLLCDPYAPIGPDDREELLSFYYVLSSQELDWDTFRNNFWEASVERLMQALGAYGFLGKVKGLDKFLEYIPSGLANLKLAASHVPSVPALRDLVELCQLMLGKS